MKKYLLFLFLITYSLTDCFSQELWLDEKKRDQMFPDTLYFKYYYESEYDKTISKSKNQSITLDKAKIEFSKMLSIEIEGSSSISNVRRDDIYNSIFKSKTKLSSSATITGLEEKVHFTKKKICHVFIYIKKTDYKASTKNQYEALIKSIVADIKSCQKMYYDGNYKDAKIKGDLIESVLEKLARKKALLTNLQIKYNQETYNEVIERFEPLYARIKKQISEEENYKYNKDKGDLKALSNDENDLENALTSYSKAQKINPNLAKEDELMQSINEVKDALYKIYCQKGMNYEQELKYPIAVDYYRKAREIHPKKNIPGEKETTTDKIKLCQDKQIDILEIKGRNELEEDPEAALDIFKEAKRLIDDMQRTDKIIAINRLIKKAQSKVGKLNKERERIIRKEELEKIRKKSPNRLVLKVGGGLHTPESYYQHIYDNPIDINKDNWHISTSIGYRMGLPNEIKTTQGGFELSRGNVVGLFGRIGSTNLIKEINNDTININSRFQEIEFGILLKEWLRLSAGLGTREIPEIYNNNFISNYYIATTGIILHFKSRFSTEFTVSYIIDEELNAQTAKFNTTLGLRFYLFKSVFKTDKDKLN